MKTKLFMTITAMSVYCIASVIVCSGQDSRIIPEHQLKSPDGKIFNTVDLLNNEKPVLICLWETICKASLNELDVISENYADWQKETGVRIIAVSIDNSRTSFNAQSVANARGWDFEIYLDVNQNFKRAMNGTLCPTTYILDGKGNIVWMKSSFIPGDEDLMYQQILAIKNK